LVHAAFIGLLPLFRLGERAYSKEDCHEKEGQEEIEGNIKKWNARKVRLSPPAARKAQKRKRPPDAGPLRYCKVCFIPGSEFDRDAPDSGEYRQAAGATSALTISLR
jgi:hypothetical protein